MTDRFENPQDTISQRVANYRQWETPIRCRDNATSIRDLIPNHISPDFLNSYLYALIYRRHL